MVLGQIPTLFIYLFFSLVLSGRFQSFSLDKQCVVGEFSDKEFHNSLVRYVLFSFSLVVHLLIFYMQFSLWEHLAGELIKLMPSCLTVKNGSGREKCLTPRKILSSEEHFRG